MWQTLTCNSWPLVIHWMKASFQPCNLTSFMQALRFWLSIWEGQLCTQKKKKKKNRYKSYTIFCDLIFSSLKCFNTLYCIYFDSCYQTMTSCLGKPGATSGPVISCASLLTELEIHVCCRSFIERKLHKWNSNSRSSKMQEIPSGPFSF